MNKSVLCYLRRLQIMVTIFPPKFFLEEGGVVVLCACTCVLFFSCNFSLVCFGPDGDDGRRAMSRTAGPCFRSSMPNRFILRRKTRTRPTILYQFVRRDEPVWYSPPLTNYRPPRHNQVLLPMQQWWHWIPRREPNPVNKCTSSVDPLLCCGAIELGK